MTVDLDGRVLCFDGAILRDLDFSLLSKLRKGGLFVVRSPGGEARTTTWLSDFLRERLATVIVYDYCLSACASYLLVASSETYVIGDTIVAWHHTTWPLCPVLRDAIDGGPRRLEQDACSDAAPVYGPAMFALKELEETFFASRLLRFPYEDPPESIPVRRVLKSMFESTGTYPNVLWTWNPRYSSAAFKTKITYEAYPSSQAELDALVARYGLGTYVIYDP
ncbi:hypothetical protein G8O24_03075 [Bradyrhizobium sp. INPA01-394B]|uniref:Uncharacterized protein n=1 Tax=Bradyrhizobium campsiandrae TaxID=1729892 RepID=A0ABR7U7Y0_9BRAD|nr:hypothetical protein [Bradyrhizobium campsiandrae]MBC9876328.1 hypothetical protein [Bradyrhizobium campsiandrae]MBC9980149.1 hypothetical protein [Bradyrhizobium campsiandrae]